MLPHVILHNMISVDGRTVGFTGDVGLYYELASRWPVDAHLAGGNTIYNPEESLPPEDESAFQTPPKDPADKRPLLVVPDSRGRVRNWHTLRQAAYWRDMLALCSHATPETYLEYLRRRCIDYVVAGDDHVDIRAALEELNARYGVKTVLLDSGGILNGVMLRAGLVDEVSLLIHPGLVGGETERSIFRAPNLSSPDGVIPVRLTHVEKVQTDYVWLRYEVVKKFAGS